MRINTINNNFKVNFSSLRTDKNQISTLKTGTMPISENKRENILTSLNMIAEHADRTNIEFLLDIVQNLNYGQAGNSEFKDIIDETTQADTKRENTDWAQILSDTIALSLSRAKEDVSDLAIKYDKLFKSKTPLSEQQKEILELRSKFQKAIIDENPVQDAQTLTQSTSILQNIDYFISSSEISLTQKKECLEKFLYLLSEKYPINPQLKDKKIQVVDEILNDMIIKKPTQEELTTKGVNQLYSGICAAISICRKAVAYEDKTRYMDIVLEELKDSDTMEVFDITELETNKKVKIPKITIDYNSAISQGYRILDASAHLWMQNAHASGNGTIQSENYIAFDDNTYGIFNDTSWYEGFNPNLPQEKSLLIKIIKEKEILDSVLKAKEEEEEASLQIIHFKKKSIETLSRINGELNRIFHSIFPDFSEQEISKIHKDIVNYYKKSQENNELNISNKMPEETRQNIIASFITETTKTQPNSQTEQLINNNAKQILGYIEDEIGTDKELKQLSSYNTKKSRYIHYRRLFQLAAAHRMATEEDINLRTGIFRFEKKTGLQPRRKQIVSYLEKLANSYTNAEDKKVQEELLYDIVKINSTIPQSLNNISKTLFDCDIKEQTKQLLTGLKDTIKYGNDDLVAMIAEISGIKNNRDQVLKYIDKQIKKIDSEISDDELDEIIQSLGFEDRIDLVKAMFSQFLSGLKQGITQEEYETLASRFGGKDKINSSIEAQQKKLNKIIEDNNEILEKWNVPSQRELIIRKMEQDNKILPYKKLDKLKARFDYIRSQSAKNDSIQNLKERQKANNKLYQFTSEEIDILNSIEKSLPYIKKYCKTAYKKLNEEFLNDLEKQYANIGMLNGQFWVREEGSTGLATNEQTRIIEQMTGKPYHIEQDIEKAAKQIKQGDGSGIISYSVDDSSYAFHAQYVPSVTTETYTNEKGEKVQEDIVWTDNSWGDAEKDYFWNGRNGFKYTDYGSGYGWKNGFILANDMRIGQTVKTIKNAIGIEEKEKEKFGLFNDMVLPGTPVNAYQKLYKMFSYILAMKQGEEFYNYLEKAIKDGAKLSIKELEGVDDLVEYKISILNKEVENIKSKDDWDKLPDDSYLKFIMSILSVYMATNNPNSADDVLSVRSYEELEDAKKDIADDVISEMGSIICKTDAAIEKMFMASYTDITSVFDEISKQFNIEFEAETRNEILNKIFYNEEKIDKLDGSITSFENYLLEQTKEVANSYIENEKAKAFFINSIQDIIRKEIEDYMKVKTLKSPILFHSPVNELFINAVDKYLKPKSDKELIDLIAGMQYADNDKADVFLSALKNEDLGIEFKDPYDYIQQLQLGNSNVTKAFYDIIANNIISEYFENKIDATIDIPTENNDGKEASTPTDLYRHLYIRLSDMDVQKYIRNFKAEAFRKYKVRQAFPEPVVLTDEEMKKVCTDMFKYFDECIMSINSDDYIIAIFDKYDEIVTKIAESNFAHIFESGNNYEVQTPKQKRELNELISMLNKFVRYVEQSGTFDIIENPAINLINVLSENSNYIDGKQAKRAFIEFNDAIRKWNSSGITRERFETTKKEDIESLKSNIKILIDTNISPKYKNEAFEKLKYIISLMEKSPNDELKEDIEYYQNDFIDYFIKKHIIKTPTKLLSECVKMAQEGKTETDEYDILKTYLIKALKIAQQTKAQYKMVQNAHDSVSSKTKDLLPMFNVTLTDGTKHSMNSEMGMIYLINMLENESDNHTTLKLFLAQSGLSELALTALINNFNEKGSRQIIDETYDIIAQNIKDYAQLLSIIEKFMNQNRIPFRSFDNAIEHMESFVKRKCKDSESEVFKKYLEYITWPGIKDKLGVISQDMITPFLASLNKNATDTVSEIINNKIDYLAGISKILEDRNNLIKIIDVPKDSDVYKQRESFESNYEKLQEYLLEKIEDIQKMTEQNTFMFNQDD